MSFSLYTPNKNSILWKDLSIQSRFILFPSRDGNNPPPPPIYSSLDIRYSNTYPYIYFLPRDRDGIAGGPSLHQVEAGSRLRLHSTYCSPCPCSTTSPLPSSPRHLFTPLVVYLLPSSSIYSHRRSQHRTLVHAPLPRLGQSNRRAL